MKKLFLIFVVACFAAACGTTNTITTETLKVEGLCSQCKTRIENAALGIEGVTKAEWDVDTKILALEFDSAKTKLDNISKAIAIVGHDTEKDKADDEVYDSLPGCCKYRG